MDTERINALLAKARHDFTAHIAAQRPELADLAARGAEDGEARLALHRAAHQIHGTAGTLGFTAISDAARTLESVTAADGPVHDLTAAHGALDAAIAELPPPAL